MKKMIFASVLVMMLSLNAFAEVTLVCKDSSSTSSNKYEVQLFAKPDDTGIAKVFVDSKEVTQLACVENHEGPKYPAPIILGCHEPDLNDAGFTLLLTDGDAAGVQYAILSEVTFVGTNELARLPCKVSMGL